MSNFGSDTPEQRILEIIESITISSAMQAKILAAVLAHVAECAYQDSKYE